MIIIGAGIAGLSAGCYARLNGYDALLLVQHVLPGGLCTSWRRGHYTFDGSTRYLTGTRAGSPDHLLWRELGVLEGVPIYHYDEFICHEARDGRSLHLYTDPDRLEEHLRSLAPEDGDTIDDLVDGIRGFRRMDLPVDLTPSDARDALALGQGVLPALGPIVRGYGRTVGSFAERFRAPLLREALPLCFQFARDDFPMMLLLTTLANMADGEAGYPIGGSLRFAEALAARCVALGAEVRYRSRVERILVEGNRAVGVRLADGSELRADVVISAADGHATIFNLLQGRYVDDRILSYYRGLPVCQAIKQVSLGIEADLSGVPETLSFPLREPMDVGGIPHERLVPKHYAFDPTMAPSGKASARLWCAGD